MDRYLRIGTRKSQLAMWQTTWVARRLHTLHPGMEIEVEGVVSAGDRDQSRPLPAIGGKGLFTEVLDEALRAGEIDLAVHSLKDLPTSLTEGLALVAVTDREDPRDVFVGKGGTRLLDLPKGAAVGSSSMRRRALIRHLRPDLEIVDIRGNVETRLRRVAENEDLHGTLLALAGLKRLGLLKPGMEILEMESWLPAVGQGALGIVTRDDDDDMIELLSQLNHAPTRAAVTAERALLARLEGGCHVPIGALARMRGNILILDSLIASPDGERVLRDHAEGAVDNPEALGIVAAERLLAQGGDEILRALQEEANETP